MAAAPTDRQGSHALSLHLRRPPIETLMIKTHSNMLLEITAYDPQTLENELNAAEAAARTLAMQDRDHGILVTRHNHTTYTVALSREIPYGETHEQCNIP